MRSSKLFDVVWIRDNKTLLDYCRHWQTLPLITLDTEFLRETTFYPIAGLIQLSDGKTPYLIDPLTISDWSGLADLLASNTVVKILHACSEDLELLYQLTNVKAVNVFDTQVAAAFLGMGISIGYSKLIKELLDHDISKEEVRSDWLHRPLTVEQEQYAASDIMYLVPLYHYFLEKLTPLKQSWLLEDTDELALSFTKQPNFEMLYEKSKQAWRLSRQQLAVLKALYIWREKKARDQDIARGRLLKDMSLFMMAKYLPSNLASLAKTQELHPRVLRVEGEAILGVIREAKDSPEQTWPELLEKPISLSSGYFAKQFKNLVYQEAEQLVICPELLWRKKIIKIILCAVQVHKRDEIQDNLTGWRKEIFTNILIKITD